jgi:RNA polymerase subunit RPABC4/transcription elongation factor Spt4
MEIVRNHIRRAPHGWRKASEYTTLLNPSASYAPKKDSDEINITGIDISPNCGDAIISRKWDGDIQVNESHPNAEAVKKAAEKVEKNEPLHKYFDEEDFSYPEWKAKLVIVDPEEDEIEAGAKTIEIFFAVGSIEEVCEKARELMKESSDIEEIQEIGLEMIDEKYRFFDNHFDLRNIRERISVPENFSKRTQVVAVTENVSIDDIHSEQNTDKESILEDIQVLENKLQDARQSVKDLELGRIE